MESLDNRIERVAFISVLLLVGQIGSSLGYYSDRIWHENLLNGEVFDFIVVGGGTGGCATAGRLAENGKYTVLLIEAGGVPHPDLEVPALRLETVTQFPNHSRTYTTVRHANAALGKNGVVNIIRGKTLGGGSAINGEVLNRGSPHDYDNWARLTGDDSWNYANMLTYFRKMENYSGGYPSDQRGFNGPMTISRPRYAPGVDTWLQAGQELGYRIAEPNGPQVVSFTRLDYTRKNGRRVSSYDGYIEPMLIYRNQGNSFHFPRKSNLLILINSEVKRIIFEGNRAVGVKFTTNGSSIVEGYASARKEIILSAGAIESPVLLMKSGVGPKSVLEAAGVPPVKYLPVGRNLHDHPFASLVVAFGNRSAALDGDNDFTPAAWREFVEFGDGPFTSDLGITFQAFLVTSALSPGERRMGWADLQLHPFNSNIRSGMWDRDNVMDLKEDEIAVPWPVFVARPRSRGSVTLNPKDVDGMPLLDFQYFTNPYDIRVLVEGRLDWGILKGGVSFSNRLKVGVRLCEETVAFQRIGCRIPLYPIQECNHLQYRSDQYWTCYGRHVSTSGFHIVGTCRMGSGENDPEAVVDSKLRVLGIQNLRVVDGSIMPAITNANAQAPIYAIAEKASDMILQEWEGGLWSRDVIHDGGWAS